MLTGAKSYEAIAQFGRDKGTALAHLLGFRRGKTPAKSTFSVLFRVLDVAAFEQALARWLDARLPADASQAIALDDKTARGSRDGDIPGHHFVAAYSTAPRLCWLFDGASRGWALATRTPQTERCSWLKPNGEKPRRTGLASRYSVPELPAVNGGPSTAIAASPVERGCMRTLDSCR
jgi:hypothetical protein